MTLRRKNDRIWQNLIDNHCPMCGELLHDTGYGLQCGMPCEFFITHDKAEQVRNELLVKQKTIGVEKVLDNGKVKFKSAKVRKGDRPKQPFTFNF